MAKYTFIPKEVTTLTPNQLRVMGAYNLNFVVVEGKLDEASTAQVVRLVGTFGYVHGDVHVAQRLMSFPMLVSWDIVIETATRMDEVDRKLRLTIQFDPVSAFDHLDMKLSIIRPGNHNTPSYVHVGRFEDVITQVPDRFKSTLVEAAKSTLAYGTITGAYPLTSGAKHLWEIKIR